jgi:hypothetical protein
MFNPDDFMNTQTNDTLDTSYAPIPEGEYTAVIDKVEAATVGTENRPVLNVYWVIDDQGVKEFTGLDTPSARQTIWLDIGANGQLEAGKNKNIALGRVRSALGQNTGAPWAPTMMQGKVATVRITHTTNPNTGAIYANVKDVAEL